ncbi:hypothetical protein HZB03_05895, partial [Candidatus Woesearchaeota archaeon]|nr:hypothetical protein [Candidatus Woesearchaeota archaeon]
MRCIFLLGGDYPELAREEVLALAKTEPAELIGRVLICDANFKWKRLGLTKKVYRFLFESKLDNIETAMEDFEWSGVYEKSFSVRITNLTKKKVSFKEAELAKYIWKKVDVPKVDLEFSQTPVELIVT